MITAPMISDADHCAHCGLPLKKAPLGGTYRCCVGAGYWAKRYAREGAMTKARYGDWQLYISLGYPNRVLIQPRFAK